MAKPRRFKSADGGRHTIHAFVLSSPIEIPASGTYTTEDKREIEVLQGSADVTEVKIPRKD
jgi:hypothetical protein